MKKVLLSSVAALAVFTAAAPALANQTNRPVDPRVDAVVTSREFALAKAKVNDAEYRRNAAAQKVTDAQNVLATKEANATAQAAVVKAAQTDLDNALAEATKADKADGNNSNAHVVAVNQGPLAFALFDAQGYLDQLNQAVEAAKGDVAKAQADLKVEEDALAQAVAEYRALLSKEGLTEDQVAAADSTAPQAGNKDNGSKGTQSSAKAGEKTLPKTSAVK